MQNNEYREWLFHACATMEEITYWLFCSAMDLSFTGELKDVLHPGEEVELQSDILLSMEDPLIQRIGKTVEAGIQLIISMKNINNLGDTATYTFLQDNPGANEEAAIMAPALFYTEQVKAIVDYLNNAMLQLQHAIWQLSAYNKNYAMANITGITTNSIYLDGDDANISIISAFAKVVEELRKEINIC